MRWSTRLPLRAGDAHGNVSPEDSYLASSREKRLFNQRKSRGRWAHPRAVYREYFAFLARRITESILSCLEGSRTVNAPSLVVTVTPTGKPGGVWFARAATVHSPSADGQVMQPLLLQM